MPKPTLEELLKEKLLPEDLSFSPFSIVQRWVDEATELAWQPNPNAMVISTLREVPNKSENTDQRVSVEPDARVVLCKKIDIEKGVLVFFTNYQSAKGEQLKQHPQATAVFHWDNLGRQIRVSGQVLRSPAMESENYFNSRSKLSRLGAWASDQSQPVESRQTLLNRLDEQKERFAVAGDNIPRPPHWGGYRLWANKVELWISHRGRIHDRAVWTREMTDIQKEEIHFNSWQATRLQP